MSVDNRDFAVIAIGASLKLASAFAVPRSAGQLPVPFGEIDPRYLGSYSRWVL